MDTQFEMLKGLSFGAFHLITLAVPEDPLTPVSFSGALRKSNEHGAKRGTTVVDLCVCVVFFPEGGSRERDIS